MADDRRIVIELKVSGSEGGDSASSALKANERETNDLVRKLRAMQNPVATLENNLLNKAFLGKTQFASYVLQQTKSLAKNSAMYFLTKYYNLTENYKAEQDLNNTMSILSHVAEGYTSVLAGAIAGAKWGGGWGAAIGAGMGATFWGANTVLNAMKAFREEDISLNTMRINSSYQQARLGLIDDGRGTQN